MHLVIILRFAVSVQQMQQCMTRSRIAAVLILAPLLNSAVQRVIITHFHRKAPLAAVRPALLITIMMLLGAHRASLALLAPRRLQSLLLVLATLDILQMALLEVV